MSPHGPTAPSEARAGGRGAGGGLVAGRIVTHGGHLCAHLARSCSSVLTLGCAPCGASGAKKSPRSLFCPGPAEFAHLQCTYLPSRSLSPVLGVAIVAPKSWEVAELINKE